MTLKIRAFFDEATYTVSYLAWDAATRVAAVIDPVLDYDPKSGRTSTGSAQSLLSAAKAEDLKVEWILETHAHADHFSAGAWLRERTGAKIAIGEHIRTVQSTFRNLFNIADQSTDGSDFDRLVRDGDRIALGNLTIEVIHTPGHTPACVSYRIADAVFVGDTLFMPDYGTARSDFPGGDAAALYHSIRKILALPDDTRVFVGHDYKAPGRDSYAWETSVKEQRQRNVQIHDGVDEAAFVASRKARDATLAPPRLLLPSLQVNIRGGRLPPPDKDGVVRFRIPVTQAI